MKKQIYVNSLVPLPLAQKARIVAAKQGVSRSQVVRQALEDYIKRVEKRGKNGKKLS